MPLLFGLAGLILGVSYPLLDEAFNSDQQDSSSPSAGSTDLTPSWGKVLLCISLFVIQYKLSAVLEEPLLGESAAPREPLQRSEQQREHAKPASIMLKPRPPK